MEREVVGGGMPGRRVQRKSRAQTLSRGGPGSAAKRVEAAIEAHPNDPLRQVASFLHDLDLQAFTGRRRTVAHRTETFFSRTLTNAVLELKKLRMPIQRIDQIGRRHVVALVAYWANERGQKAATITTKLSALRKYCELIGKAGAIPVRDELYEVLESKGVDRAALKRVQVLEGSKSWKAAGVDAYAFIEAVAAEDPHEALLFELELCLGLRVNEALSFRPRESERLNGVMVNLGTKGGMGRFVPYMKNPELAARQRDVMARAIRWAEQHPKGEMGYARMSIQEARAKYYSVLRKHGVNKKTLGVSSHGLRHQFAADMFEDITGHRPPAEGQESSGWFKENRALVDHAYKQVSEALGHWRKDISKAYLSSVDMLSKAQTQRVEKLIEMFQHTPGVAQGLVDAGVERVWITGRAAQGVELGVKERVDLTVVLEEGVNWTILTEVQGMLDKLLPGRVKLGPLLTGVQPEEGVEIFLD